MVFIRPLKLCKNYSLFTFNKFLTLMLVYTNINIHKFVHTNIVHTIMKIEEVIKATAPMTLPKRIVLNIMYSQIVLGESFNEILKPYDLSAEQYNVLRILRGQKGKPANMCVIQERMIAKTSNTTRLVDKLLLKELVTREVCPDNRRKMEVSITQKGLELLKTLDPAVDIHETEFANNLTYTEQEQFVELLEKFRRVSH